MLIVFSGLPGTGKTTIAKELAKKTGAAYLRIDTTEQVTRSVLPAIKAEHAKVTSPARWTQEFDVQLSEIAHYQRHPYLLPWVGQHYSAQRRRVLVVGESHYLDKESTIHHDAVAWYEQVVAGQVSDKERTWMRTRTVIHNGLANGWKQRSKQIYRNIEAALEESAVLDIPEGRTPFDCIAFLNFFQRPAETSGDSISVKQLDIVHSTQVLRDVLTALKPDLVIFGSKLASRAAGITGLRDAFASTVFRTTPHPATSWWYRPMARHKGKSGRALFVEAMNCPVAD